MFKLLGILLLVLYFGFLAQQYAIMKKSKNGEEEIRYRFRPATATSDIGNESFLRTHYDMFQKNAILFSGDYTTELLDNVNDNLEPKGQITIKGDYLKMAQNICDKCYVKRNNEGDAIGCYYKQPKQKNWLDNTTITDISCVNFKDFHCSKCDEFIDTFEKDKRDAVLLTTRDTTTGKQCSKELKAKLKRDDKKFTKDMKRKCYEVLKHKVDEKR